MVIDSWALLMMDSWPSGIFYLRFCGDGESADVCRPSLFMSVACICPECDAKIFKAGGLLLCLLLRLRLSLLLDVEMIKKTRKKKNRLHSHKNSHMGGILKSSADGCKLATG